MARTTSLTALWASHATGRRGWTTLPRLVVWFCVPALVMGLAAVVTMVSGSLLSPTHPLRFGYLRASAGIDAAFSIPAFVLTPIAALLTLVISVRRMWSLRVIVILWSVLILCAALLLPALEATLTEFIVLHGAPPAGQ